MAMRSGGGTGVIVALVVFIVLSVGLLTLSIVFHTQKTKAEELRQTAEADLREIISAGEQGQEAIKSMLGEAKSNRQSLVKHLIERDASFRTAVAGSPDASIDSMRAQLRFADGRTLADAYRQLSQENSGLQGELDQMKARVQAQTESVESLRRELADARQVGDEKVSEVRESIKTWVDSNEDNAGAIRDAVEEYLRATDRNEQFYRSQIDDLRNDLDEAATNELVLATRLKELRAVVDAIRVRPQSPAELVDGRIIEILGSDNQVFVDLGRRDRVVPGMTFEIYEDPFSIRIDPMSGEYSRGKASLQIIKVAETTSTARVTRGATSRPVVRGDVIANAVFDPKYRFKFLVHGRFDADGNSIATLDEADFVRSRIIEWGGEVIDGEQLTGDLDFLVLGEEPPIPAPLPANASEERTESFLRARDAYERYQALLRRALDAQIPVLNLNRFRILTGEVRD